MTAGHDSRCELGNTRAAFNRPPVGSCWCEDRAFGFEFWVFATGAARTETSRAPEGAVPPNELGGAA